MNSKSREKNRNSNKYWCFVLSYVQLMLADFLINIELYKFIDIIEKQSCNICICNNWVKNLFILLL